MSAACVVQEGTREAVVIDGHKGPLFSQTRYIDLTADGRAYGQMALFSADSQSVAYIGVTDEGDQVVVVDGQPMPGFIRQQRHIRLAQAGIVLNQQETHHVLPIGCGGVRADRSSAWGR